MTINVGKILKPQGIKGEVKILPLVDDVSRFRKVKYLIVKGQALPVLSLRIADDYVYCALQGVDDRNKAETLRDEFVAVKREDAVRLEEGRHFIVDLIGCEIYAGDKRIGVLDDVLQHTKTDVYLLKTGKGIAMFPVVDDVILSTDTEHKKIVVDEKRLSEIIVYED